jgi:pyrroline-5-carboxylate reductase
MAQAGKSLTLTFLGGGKIAQAMMQGLKHQGLGSSLSIHAVDPNEKRLAELRAKGYHAHGHLTDSVAKQTDVLVLAVKPQQANEALRSLMKTPLKQSSLVISVVAGLPLKRISDSHPGTSFLVRAMPNTPATIGKGITVWMASPETDTEHFETTRLILRASK